jgi:hypothetical protein
MSDDRYPITEAEYLDLSRLVRRLRRASIEKSSIPVHSGRAPSLARKKHRARRRELMDEIRQLEREIVGWSLAVIPIVPSEMTVDTAEKGEEWQCELCGSIWPNEVNVCEGFDDSKEDHTPVFRPDLREQPNEEE